MLALESARRPKAHDNRSELRNKRHCADSAMPRNPAKDSRPSFGRGLGKRLGISYTYCGKGGLRFDIPSIDTGRILNLGIRIIEGDI